MVPHQRDASRSVMMVMGEVNEMKVFLYFCFLYFYIIFYNFIAYLDILS